MTLYADMPPSDAMTRLRKNAARSERRRQCRVARAAGRTAQAAASGLAGPGLSEAERQALAFRVAVAAEARVKLAELEREAAAIRGWLEREGVTL